MVMEHLVWISVGLAPHDEELKQDLNALRDHLFYVYEEKQDHKADGTSRTRTDR